MNAITRLLKGTSDFSNAKRTALPMNQVRPQGQTYIRDMASTWWFSPLQPVQPVSPPGYRPRQWGFQPGANIIWQPKGEDSPITYETLRNVADAWDLLRIMIEQQKDRLCSVRFDIRAKQQPGESNSDRKQRNAKDPTVKALKEFWECPDGVNSFREWLRMWIEDMIVLDATALYMARDDAGKVHTIHPIAGDDINRLLNDQGLTPAAPDPAYQQVLYGYPVWDFSSDDLLYYMRNPRTNRRYGYGPVEQIIRTITLGLRRLTWQLAEYTQGNIPEMMVFLDNDLPIDRVSEIQNWFDSIMAGDLERRRQVRFLPGTGTPGEKTANMNVIQTKAPLLKDELDVWLAQVAAYCIGVSAQPFMKMINRASAEQAQETSEEEGKRPFIDSILTVLNNVTQRKMGFAGYEWVDQQQEELDVLKAAQADNLLVGKVYTINEVRERRGEDPRSEPEADQLGMFSPMNGFIPLGQVPMQPSPGGPDGPDGKPPKPAAGAGAENGEKAPKKTAA